MNKKIMLISLLLIIGGVIATPILNDIFSQTQFNELDFDNLDYGMEITNSYIANDRLFVEFEYNTFEKELDENNLDTNNFVFKQKTGRIPYYLGNYRTCLDTNTNQECNKIVINFVYDKAKAFRNNESKRLVNLKTKEIVEGLNIIDFTTLYVNYDKFESNTNYVIGDIIVYDNELYEVIQAHTSQATWTPNITPSLFKVKVLSETGEIRAWVQPIGASDCYELNALVTFNGFTYKNTGSNCNVWAPNVYGWTKQ